MITRHLMLQSDRASGGLWWASLAFSAAALGLAHKMLVALVLPGLAFVLGYLAYRQHRRQWRRPDQAGLAPLWPMLLAVLVQAAVLAYWFIR